MHVDTLEAHRSGIEVKVNAPERGSKGVGQTRSALVVERVALAKDEGSGLLGRSSGENGIVLGEMALDRAYGPVVVHQGALQGDAKGGGTADVAVGFISTSSFWRETDPEAYLWVEKYSMFLFLSRPSWKATGALRWLPVPANEGAINLGPPKRAKLGQCFLTCFVISAVPLSHCQAYVLSFQFEGRTGP